MEWVSVKTRLPKRPMNLLVWINGTVFNGEAYIHDGCIKINRRDDFVLFEVQNVLVPAGLDSKYTIVVGENGWKMPQHFREPEYWLEIPEIEEELKE